MHMLLLSLGLGAVPEYVKLGSKIGFVPTAGETYADPTFVKDDRVRLGMLGYQLEDIDISRSDKNKLLSQIDKCDALFVAGGNTFHLLQQIRLANIEDALVARVRAGKFYIGASAGAAVVGPSVEPIKTLDDASAAPKLASTNGMALVDFVVLPHYGKEKYLPRYDAIQKEYSERFRLIPLRDDQAISVSGEGDYTIVNSALILHPLPL